MGWTFTSTLEIVSKEITVSIKLMCVQQLTSLYVPETNTIFNIIVRLWICIKLFTLVYFDCCTRRWLLNRFISSHLQSSQGSTRSCGSDHDGFVSMDAIDFSLDPAQNNQAVQNGRPASRLTKTFCKSKLFFCYGQRNRSSPLILGEKCCKHLQVWEQKS